MIVVSVSWPTAEITGVWQEKTARQRTCGVAGDDDCLDLLGFQKVYDLAGITDDGIFRFGTVRHTRGISKIYDSFVGQVSHNLTHYGQSADTGIKDADRRRSGSALMPIIRCSMVVFPAIAAR